jgi:hypothetical protein
MGGSNEFCASVVSIARNARLMEPAIKIACAKQMDLK